MTQRKRAVRFSAGTSLSRRNSLVLLSASGVLPDWAESSAAKRAEWTPGLPLSASTSRPESSARTKSGFEFLIFNFELSEASHFASSTAFFVALPAKVSASSMVCGAPGKSLSVRNWNWPPRMARISPVLWALRVAMRIVVTQARYQARTAANKEKLSVQQLGEFAVFALKTANEVVVMADVPHRPRDEINAQNDEAEVDQEQR